MDDLSAVIALVHAFLGGENEQVREAATWLDDLAWALDDVDKDVEAGCFDRQVTIEDLSMLDDVLDRCPHLEDFEEGEIDKFPWNMLHFWLREAERRGREVIDIAIGSVSLRDACSVGNALKTLRYPIR